MLTKSKRVLLVLVYLWAANVAYAPVHRIKVDIPKPEPVTTVTKEELLVILKHSCRVEGVKWNKRNLEAMVKIAWKESRFDPMAQNPSSSAFGIWQFLDSTWENYGVEKTHDPKVQTIGAVRYVKAKFGTPVKALAFHEKRGYY